MCRSSRPLPKGPPPFHVRYRIECSVGFVDSETVPPRLLPLTSTNLSAPTPPTSTSFRPGLAFLALPLLLSPPAAVVAGFALVAPVVVFALGFAVVPQLSEWSVTVFPPEKSLAFALWKLSPLRFERFLPPPPPPIPQLLSSLLLSSLSLEKPSSYALPRGPRLAFRNLRVIQP